MKHLSWTTHWSRNKQAYQSVHKPLAAQELRELCRMSMENWVSFPCLYKRHPDLNLSVFQVDTQSNSLMHLPIILLLLIIYSNMNKKDIILFLKPDHVVPALKLSSRCPRHL